MKKENLIAVIPVRAGSQRVKNKNIRNFSNSSLLEIKIKTLKKVLNKKQIVVNSDCHKMLSIADNLGVRTQVREDYYASSDCNNSDFFENIAMSIDSDYIMYSPVTSPLVSKETYLTCINKFFNSKIENLVTVSNIKHHLWLDNKPLNYDPRNSPNSQDLPDIFSLNYGVCIISRNDMIKHKNIVTNNPYFYVLNEIESIDIDTEFDFMIAEMVYNKLKGQIG